ncbi:hypothetical protein N6H18_14615 [Reichenbachiella agarivorans]|uniref:DUF4168 domain-containing protein n=1 Tax=Reichenbachiella agarivorans TaxID=2979464 RepID=A0ABY6CM34_9BACT|nr:hypothetical protein [Reichenbachiella agarivorans]UXP31582.1 hypothetical protein N6H18_14615 [Reichenbachiella agarivorans]
MIKTILSAIAVLSLALSAQAQEQITTEQLTQYAQVMMDIDSMKTDLTAKSNDLVKGDPLMDGGRRFNDIKGADGDETKLAELNVTAEELAAYNQIQETIDKMKFVFKNTYTEAIRGGIGATQFNQIRSALKTDPELSAQYAEIVEKLQEPESQEG